MKLVTNNTFKNIVTAVLVLFCGFQIFRMWFSFLQREAVENPLVPDYLETGIRNYILFFTVIYLLVALANLWGWYKKSSFYIVSAVSFAVIVAVQLLSPMIIDYFLNNPIG